MGRTKKLSYAGIGLIILTTILYSPMLLGTGFDIGLNSGYMHAHFDWQQLVIKAEEISRRQIGFYKGAYLAIGLNIGFLFFTKHKKIIFINLVLLLCPYIINILFNTHLPARALSFQFVAYLFSALLFLEILFRFAHKTFTIILTIMCCLYLNYVSINHTFFDWSYRPDKGAYEVAEILQKENINSLLDLDGKFGYFIPSILYHYKINDREILCWTSKKKSQRYLDSNSYNGQCFVLSTSKYKQAPKDKILYQYKDESNAFTIYLREHD